MKNSSNLSTVSLDTSVSNNWHQRYRRIIDSLWTALQEADPVAARHMAARLTEFGEGWVVNNDPVDVEEKLSATEIARRFGFNPWDVHNWARAGNLTKYGTESRPLFRLGDVLRYQALKDQRK